MNFTASGKRSIVLYQLKSREEVLTHVLNYVCMMSCVHITKELTSGK